MPRTDNDSWDLASSVGATATAVAASRAMASKGPDALLDDPFADPLVRAVGLEHFVKMVDGEIAIDDDPLLNRRAMNEQIAVRTRFFDTFFTTATGGGDSAEAAAAGVRQAVILASGLDTRAYRLPWPADMAVFEVDQPEVIAFKGTTLGRLGATPGATLRTVGIDLRDDWPAALRDAGFDPSAATAWIAEGLLVYLPPEAQDRLFDNITALSAPGSRIATEHMDMTSLPEDFARLLTERSRRLGSEIDLTDLFYDGERHSAGDYLSSQGWTVTVQTTEEAFASNGFQLPEDPLTVGMAVTSGYLSAILK